MLHSYLPKEAGAWMARVNAFQRVQQKKEDIVRSGKGPVMRGAARRILSHSRCGALVPLCDRYSAAQLMTAMGSSCMPGLVMR
jgi:hypothetical protein